MATSTYKRLQDLNGGLVCARVIVEPARSFTRALGARRAVDIRLVIEPGMPHTISCGDRADSAHARHSGCDGCVRADKAS